MWFSLGKGCEGVGGISVEGVKDWADMDYKYNQKMSLVRLLLDIISIDETLDERETLYFEKVKKELNLSSEDHFKVKDFSTLLCLSILKGMTEEQKENYAALMKNMILADVIIEPSELLAYEDICKFCDIPVTELNI